MKQYILFELIGKILNFSSTYTKIFQLKFLAYSSFNLFLLLVFIKSSLYMYLSYKRVQYLIELCVDSIDMVNVTRWLSVSHLCDHLLVCVLKCFFFFFFIFFRMKFFNIFNMRHNSVTPKCFCHSCESDKTHWTVRCWTCLILSKCYSQDLPVWPWNPVLVLPGLA